MILSLSAKEQRIRCSASVTSKDGGAKEKSFPANDRAKLNIEPQSYASYSVLYKTILTFVQLKDK